MSKPIKRREFIKQSAQLSALGLILGLSQNKVFGAVQKMIENNAIPYKTLGNGIRMPMLGFGTNTLKGELGRRCVAEAISVGYRLIDTAHVYGNEEAVGLGIKDSGIQRSKLFITSKLWVDDFGAETTPKAFQRALDKLQLDYIDLYLLHRPRGDVKGAWQALEDLHAQGKIKAIGVSNFSKEQLDELMSYAKIKPAINQIESNVFFQQEAARAELKSAHIPMEAWSPFAAGRNGIFENPTLAEISRKHGKSVAQVVLRWHHQRDIVVIPRSSQKAHMAENLEIFNFELDQDDFDKIASLDVNTTQFPEWE